MSTNPGATTHPLASMVRVAAASPSRPTAATRPSRTPTSAVYAGSPEPSTTVPPRTSRSSSGTGETALFGTVVVLVFDAVDPCRVRTDDLALSLRWDVLDALHELVDHARVLGVGVREVARPDEVVLAREVGHRAHGALAGVEADHTVAPEVLARREAERRREGPVVRLEELVEAVHPVRDPAAAALEHEHLQLRMPLEHAAVHEPGEREVLVHEEDERVVRAHRHEIDHALAHTVDVEQTGTVQTQWQPRARQCLVHRVEVR